MKRTAPVLLCLTVAFLGGYVYGQWHAKSPVVSANTGRRILYYRCPMHPSYRSNSPGTAPCCNMPLQPVYEGDAAPPSNAAIRITPQQRELIGVQFETVEFTPAFSVIRGAARVGVNEERIVRVQTKLEGFIDQLYVKSVGEPVKKGQLLLSIYNRRAYSMAQSEFLRAMMDSSGMGLSAAAAASPEARNAAHEGLLAAREHLSMLGFTEDQIEAVARAHQPLRSFPLYASIDGIVIGYNAALNQEPGMEPLLTIADLSNVWVTAGFSAAEAATIRPGQNATLTAPFAPDRVFHGSVDRILPELDADTRQVKVRLVFDNSDQSLRPQMYGEVELHTGAGKQRLTVRQEAVLDSGHTRSVFLDLGDGYLEPHEVITGERFGDRIEIVHGLTAGQRVVTSGNFLLDSETQIHSRR